MLTSQGTHWGWGRLERYQPPPSEWLQATLPPRAACRPVLPCVPWTLLRPHRFLSPGAMLPGAGCKGFRVDLQSRLLSPCEVHARPPGSPRVCVRPADTPPSATAAPCIVVGRVQRTDSSPHPGDREPTGNVRDNTTVRCSPDCRVLLGRSSLRKCPLWGPLSVS